MQAKNAQKQSSAITENDNDKNLLLLQHKIVDSKRKSKPLNHQSKNFLTLHNLLREKMSIKPYQKISPINTIPIESTRYIGSTGGFYIGLF